MYMDKKLKVATGAYASATSPASEVGVFRDAFGFRQVIVAATARGVVYGLDSSNGAVLWSRLYEDKDGVVTPVKVFTLRTVSDGETPQVVVVAQRKTPQVRIGTRISSGCLLMASRARRTPSCTTSMP